MDIIDTQVELRSKHKQGEVWAGIDVFEGKVADMKEKEVVEPALVKEQMIKAAVEAASMLLRIDDVIAASKMKEEKGKGKEGGEEESEFSSKSSSSSSLED